MKAGYFPLPEGRITPTLEEEIYAELDKNIWKWSGLRGITKLYSKERG